MIAKEDVLKIAELSALKLSPEELQKYFHELSDIISFFKKLEKIDTQKIEPLLCSSLVEDVVFKDEPVLSSNQEPILKNAPGIQAGFLKTESFSK